MGTCAKCGCNGYVMPMHGEKGGPLMCPMCMGAENARQANKAKAARLLFRAVDMYFKNGGKNAEVDFIVNAGALARLNGGALLQGIGVKMDGAAPELTKELLLQTIQLTHPDRHPPERQDMAREVTQKLTAMQPFVLPEEKERHTPKRPSPVPPKPSPLSNVMKEVVAYPCADCRGHVPYYYCDTCKAEYERRRAAETERKRKKQREQYASRRARTAWVRQRECAACNKTFEPVRADARYCSNACRQKAHRRRQGKGA